MKLLNALEVKKEKLKNETECIERIRKINKEESESIKRLNNLREYEKNGNVRIEKIRIQLSKSESELKVQKSVLLSEVLFLEERKQKALEPIDIIRQNANKLLQQSYEENLKVNKREKEIKESFKNLSEKIKIVTNIEKIIEEKNHALNTREYNIQSAEAELNRSIKKLSQSWVEYHKESMVKMLEIEKREKDIKDQYKINNDFRITLENKEFELMQPVHLKMKEAESMIEENNALHLKLTRREDELSEKELTIINRDKESKARTFILNRCEKDNLKNIAIFEKLSSELKVEKKRFDAEIREKFVLEEDAHLKLKERERQIAFKLETIERTKLQLSNLEQVARNTVQSMQLKEDLIIRRETAIDIKEKTIATRMQSSDIIEKDAQFKLANIDSRESKLSKLEMNVNKIIKENNEEREKFEFDMSVRITEVISRDKEIEYAKIINENFKTELDKKEKYQLEKDREIQDRYATLSKSIERFNKLKNTNGGNKV